LLVIVLISELFSTKKLSQNVDFVLSKSILNQKARFVN